MIITNQIVIKSATSDTMTVDFNDDGNIHLTSFTFKPEESEELLTHLHMAIETVKRTITVSAKKGGSK